MDIRLANIAYYHNQRQKLIKDIIDVRNDLEIDILTGDKTDLLVTAVAPFQLTFTSFYGLCILL